MSGEQTDHTAPTLAHARNATIVCGTFGRIATTRSPGTTPSARSDAASDATWRSSSRHETSPQRAGLVARDDRGPRVGRVAERLVGDVQPRAGKPLRPGHRTPAEHALVRHRGADVEEVPDRAPEALEVGDRPAPQRLVVGERQAALAFEPRQERRDAGAPDPLRRGTPKGLDARHGAVSASLRARRSRRDFIGTAFVSAGGVARA